MRASRIRPEAASLAATAGHRPTTSCSPTCTPRRLELVDDRLRRRLVDAKEVHRQLNAAAGQLERPAPARRACRRSTRADRPRQRSGLGDVQTGEHHVERDQHAPRADADRARRWGGGPGPPRAGCAPPGPNVSQRPSLPVTIEEDGKRAAPSRCARPTSRATSRQRSSVRRAERDDRARRRRSDSRVHARVQPRGRCARPRSRSRCNEGFEHALAPRQRATPRCGGGRGRRRRRARAPRWPAFAIASMTSRVAALRKVRAPTRTGRLLHGLLG